jgi:hypothetical protein
MKHELVREGKDADYWGKGKICFNLRVTKYMTSAKRD